MFSVSCSLTLFDAGKIEEFVIANHPVYFFFNRKINSIL
ncbi:unnamed protein product [Tenebrio molitor]|nr:unnamed protein product [Tenebrio molitor]